VRKPEGDNFKSQAWLNRRIILKMIFKKYDWRKWTGFIWLRIKKCGGLI
jgi:hypothetical protein